MVSQTIFEQRGLTLDFTYSPRHNELLPTIIGFPGYEKTTVTSCIINHMLQQVIRHLHTHDAFHICEEPDLSDIFDEDVHIYIYIVLSNLVTSKDSKIEEVCVYYMHSHLSSVTIRRSDTYINIYLTTISLRGDRHFVRWIFGSGCLVDIFRMLIWLIKQIALEMVLFGIHCSMIYRLKIFYITSRYDLVLTNFLGSYLT